MAPGLAIAPALAAWAVVPFSDTLVLANIDASLLYVMAIASVGVHGIILAGWASNSKYAFPRVRCAQRHRWCPMKSRWASR